jgi:hypothetical protein
MGARRWQCFDATPTCACLPCVPARVAALTPRAKVVFMVSGSTSERRAGRVSSLAGAGQ